MSIIRKWTGCNTKTQDSIHTNCMGDYKKRIEERKEQGPVFGIVGAHLHLHRTFVLMIDLEASGSGLMYDRMDTHGMIVG